MQLILCTDDKPLLARWTAASPLADSCPAAELPKRLASGEQAICLIDLDCLPPETLGKLVEWHPAIRFMAMSSQPHPGEGVPLLQIGAKGYANRQISAELLRIAIEVISNGQIWAGADTIGYLLGQQAPEQAQPHAHEILSERELQVAELVQQGMSNRQIAAQLGITERTVKSHLNSAYGKSATSSRLQLALWLGTPGQTTKRFSA